MLFYSQWETLCDFLMLRWEGVSLRHCGFRWHEDISPQSEEKREERAWQGEALPGSQPSCSAPKGTTAFLIWWGEDGSVNGVWNVKCERAWSNWHGASASLPISFFSVLWSQRKCSQLPVLSKRLRTSMVGSGSIYCRLTLDPAFSLVRFWERNRRGLNNWEEKGWLTFHLSQSGAGAIYCLIEQAREVKRFSPAQLCAPLLKACLDTLSLQYRIVTSLRSCFCFVFLLCLFYLLSFTYVTVIEIFFWKLCIDTRRLPCKLHIGFACIVKPISIVSYAA